MAAARPSAKPTASAGLRGDGQPTDWTHGLRSAGQDRQAARARLRAVLLAAAHDEALRRWPDQSATAGRGGHATSQRKRDDRRAENQFTELPDRAADGAVTAISGQLDRYRADTRFTTWAYKYVMFALSDAAGRHFWGSQPRPQEYDWRQLATLRPTDLPASGREWRDTLAAVRRAVDLELTASQRAIFAAVTLGDLPPEALTSGLGPDRSAIYRALFEARRRVGARLAADGIVHSADVPQQPGRQVAWLLPLLAADPGDTGCDVAFQALDRYAGADLAGSDPRPHFPGVAAHIAGCRPCGQDYEGLLAAARRGEPSPDATRPA
jgi:RNA polymerase sigma-70 factor, ECF subfamily